MCGGEVWTFSTDPALARPRPGSETTVQFLQHDPRLGGRTIWRTLERGGLRSCRTNWMERHVLFRHVVVANSPPAARHVLLENHANYEKTPQLPGTVLEPGLGRGLISAQGAEWKRQRRIMAPAFNAKTLKSFEIRSLQRATS